MFSSHNDQYSYVDNLSHFTKSFAEAILNYEGNDVKYTSIIDYIKDSFSGSERQTPYFVNQGSLTDSFCTMSEIISGIDISKYMSIPEVETKESVSLYELIVERSKSYYPKEEIEIH